MVACEASQQSECQARCSRFCSIALNPARLTSDKFVSVEGSIPADFALVGDDPAFAPDCRSTWRRAARFVL
jgi:hypothetical protein